MDNRKSVLPQAKMAVFDRIEGEKIILDAGGLFPKKVVIIEKDGGQREYELKRTRKGGYLFN